MKVIQGVLLMWYRYGYLFVMNLFFKRLKLSVIQIGRQFFQLLFILQYSYCRLVYCVYFNRILGVFEYFWMDLEYLQLVKYVQKVCYKIEFIERVYFCLNCGINMSLLRVVSLGKFMGDEVLFFFVFDYFVCFK